MATPWCRLWADLPNDPKWRTIARASAQPISAVVAVYIHMLVCASNATERGRTQGWNDEDVASALDLDTDQITAIRDAMQGRVLDGEHLSGWDKRQPAREDGAADRAKSWRNNKKQKEAEENERKRTQTNADKRPEVDTEVDKDKEEDKTLSASLDAAQADGADLYVTAKRRKLTGERLQTFNQFMDVFGDRRGKAQAADAWFDIKPLTRPIFESIMDGAERYCEERRAIVSSGSTPKMAQGWLSGRRWEDVPLDIPCQSQSGQTDEELAEKGLER